MTPGSSSSCSSSAAALQVHGGVSVSLVVASPAAAAEGHVCPGVVLAQVSFVMGAAAESAYLWCSIMLWCCECWKVLLEEGGICCCVAGH